jgi:hypothetical protein
MSAIDRRLRALERSSPAGQGLRIFQQTLADENVFHEGIDNADGVPFSRDEISALAAVGWQVIRVEYAPQVAPDWRAQRGH